MVGVEVILRRHAPGATPTTERPTRALAAYDDRL